MAQLPFSGLSVGSNSSDTFLQGALTDLDTPLRFTVAPATITIFKNGSTIIARDVWGNTLTTGSEIGAVFNSVMGQLPARTSRITTKLVGAFNLTTTCNLVDLTIIDISEATITVTADLTGTSGSSVFRGNTVDQVSIIGKGTLNCENLVQHGIYFNTTSTNVSSYQVIVRNTRSHNIYFNDCDGYSAIECDCGMSGDDTITALQSTNGWILNNKCRPGSTVADTGQSFGVEIEDGTTNTIISGNNIKPWAGALLGQGAGGILIDASPSPGQDVCHDITVTDNDIEGVSNKALMVSSQNPAFTLPTTGHIIANNRITNHDGSLANAVIEVTNAQECVFENNTIDGSSAGGLQGWLVTSCVDFKISGGFIKETQRQGMLLLDCSRFTLSNIDIKNIGLNLAGNMYAVQLTTTTVTDLGATIENIAISDDQGTPTTSGMYLGAATNLAVLGGGSIDTLDSDVIGWAGSLDSSVNIASVKGFVTNNSGIQNYLTGNSNLTILHGLDRTPLNGQIEIHAIDAIGAPAEWYIIPAQLNATQFRIVFTTQPAGDADFAWSIANSGYVGA